MTRSILFLNLACLAMIITTSEGDWSPLGPKFKDVNSYCEYKDRLGACTEDIYDGHLDYICQHLFCTSASEPKPGVFLTESVGKAPSGTPCGHGTQMCNGEGECVMNDPQGEQLKLPREPSNEKSCRLSSYDEEAMDSFYQRA